MEVVTVKIPHVLRRRLIEEARRRRVSQSTVVRETLEAALLEKPRERGELSCADLAGELVGSFRGGPKDLSTNKRYLEEAILADARRAKKRRR